MKPHQLLFLFQVILPLSSLSEQPSTGNAGPKANPVLPKPRQVAISVSRYGKNQDVTKAYVNAVITEMNRIALKNAARQSSCAIQFVQEGDVLYPSLANIETPPTIGVSKGIAGKPDHYNKFLCKECGGSKDGRHAWDPVLTTVRIVDYINIDTCATTQQGGKTKKGIGPPLGCAIPGNSCFFVRRNVPRVTTKSVVWLHELIHAAFPGGDHSSEAMPTQATAAVRSRISWAYAGKEAEVLTSPECASFLRIFATKGKSFASSN